MMRKMQSYIEERSSWYVHEDRNECNMAYLSGCLLFPVLSLLCICKLKYQKGTCMKTK